MGVERGRFVYLGHDFLKRTHTLRETLHEAVQNSDLCCKLIVEFCQQISDDALAITHEKQGKVIELQKQLKALEEQCNQREKDLGIKDEQVRTLEELKIREKEKQCSLEKRVGQLIEREKLQKEIITDDWKGIEEQLSYQKKKLEAKLEAVNWYNKVLGIRAEFSNAIKFVFIKIDPNNPQREFTFTIRLDKHSNKYTMLECVPQLPKADVLVYELNISNMFFEFVRLMRQDFVQLIAR